METELKNCKTMAEILAVVSKHYNLHKPLGIATKMAVITGLRSVLKMINATPYEKKN